MVKIYTEEEFSKMREAGALASKQIKSIDHLMVPHTKLIDIDDFIRKDTFKNNAYPAPLKYLGKGDIPYPKSICVSINNVVCHGIPSKYKLKDGDIINVDITPRLNGWHGDTSKTFMIGNVSDIAKKLVQTTYDCLMLGIEAVKPGNPIRNIGIAIQTHAENNGFSVVRDLCGHGIGTEFHIEPQILHFNEESISYQDLIMEPGMIFTIEPMINVGSYEIEAIDNWVYVTKDGNLSAQFEHTIGVTETGYEIFTI